MHSGIKARSLLYEKLKSVLSQSCFVELVKGHRKSEPLTKHKTVLPTGVKEKVQEFEINNNLSQSENINSFKNILTLNDLEIKNIQQEIKDQSKSNDWFIQIEE